MQPTSTLPAVSTRNYIHICLMTLIALTVIAMPELAFADENPLGKVLCNIVGFITGTTGKAIATIAIIIVGVGALMGKVSWGMAIIVGLGVAIIFGAGTLVNEIGEGAGDDGMDPSETCNN